MIEDLKRSQSSRIYSSSLFLKEKSQNTFRWATLNVIIWLSQNSQGDFFSMERFTVLNKNLYQICQGKKIVYSQTIILVSTRIKTEHKLHTQPSERLM